MAAPLRVLALMTYPPRAAATRYRIEQYVGLLEERGIRLDRRPFLSDATFAGMYDRRKVLRTVAGLVAGTARRALDVLRLGSYDAVFLQREAALIGPPLVEWLAKRRVPIVLDLDDATYIERSSDIFGGLASVLKSPSKTLRLIRWSHHVICGNPTIAAFVREQDVPTTVLPTIVDVDRFTPRAPHPGRELVIGWIGTHSTFSYFRMLIPVLERLARDHHFRVRLVGAGSGKVTIEGVVVESIDWSLGNEIADLQSFDVAVYPIEEDPWASGKSGFKAIQYLSCGIPYVASPVGVVGEIGDPGTTHLEARTDEDWYRGLSRLLTDASLRSEMGRCGRDYATRHFSTTATADRIAAVLRDAVDQYRQKKGNRLESRLPD